MESGKEVFSFTIIIWLLSSNANFYFNFQELARVEEEINTLRTVLASKTRHASDLKRKLGITVWKEVTDDVNQGLKNLKESTV